MSLCSTAPSSRRRASCGLMLVRSISRPKTSLMKVRSSASVAPSWKCEVRAVRIIDLIVSFSFEGGTPLIGFKSTLGRCVALEFIQLLVVHARCKSAVLTAERTPDTPEKGGAGRGPNRLGEAARFGSVWPGSARACRR